MDKPNCSEPGCSNEATHAPKMSRCGRCNYRRQRQHGKKHTATCTVCASEYTTHRQPRGKPCCSARCRQAMAQPLATAASRRTRPRPLSPISARQCEWCLALHFTNTKLCSSQCRTESAAHRSLKQRSELRIAYEDGHWTDLTRILLAQTDTTGDCSIWNGRENGGYPVVRIGKRDHQVHRLVLQAKHHGAPLGVQAAHHTCANPLCINPDHLQPVTHRDNIAEMLARHTYLNRITELEKALAVLDPNHPALNRIEVA